MNKQVAKKFILVVAPILVMVMLFVFFMDRISPSNPTPTEVKVEEGVQAEGEDQKLENEDSDSMVEDVDELLIEDIEEGAGEPIEKGDTVKVHYKGTLLDGTEFDSSYSRGEPYEVTVGESSVIEGWHKGLPGMKVGGKRKLTIPSELGYGESGSGSIPPNAGLVFEIELVEVVE